MATFIIRRLLITLLLLFLVTLITFFGFRLLANAESPEHRMVMTEGSVPITYFERFKQTYSDNSRPLITQYSDWIVGIFHGNLGNSLYEPY